MHPSLHPVFIFPKASYLSYHFVFSALTAIRDVSLLMWCWECLKDSLIWHIRNLSHRNTSCSSFDLFLFSFAALILQPGGLSFWRQMGYGFLLCLPNVCFSVQPLPVIVMSFLISDISWSERTTSSEIFMNSRSNKSLLILPIFSGIFKLPHKITAKAQVLNHVITFNPQFLMHYCGLTCCFSQAVHCSSSFRWYLIDTSQQTALHSYCAVPDSYRSCL